MGGAFEVTLIMTSMFNMAFGVTGRTNIYFTGGFGYQTIHGGLETRHLYIFLNIIIKSFIRIYVK
tara:strand:- start:354 stop:548 length:195 start_codon:yes stop_codon:yes gene_type:complete